MIQHKKLMQSFVYASEGVWHALKYNQNLRVHFIVAICVIILAIVLRISGFEMAVLGLTILLVIASEMINSALEEMVDLITTEHRKEAKVAKDVAAGMVLVTSVGSIIVGLLIFLPHIFH
jgi:diacylglycerol kinase (ATP)